MFKLQLEHLYFLIQSPILNKIWTYLLLEDVFFVKELSVADHGKIVDICESDYDMHEEVMLRISLVIMSWQYLQNVSI